MIKPTGACGPVEWRFHSRRHWLLMMAGLVIAGGLIVTFAYVPAILNDFEVDMRPFWIVSAVVAGIVAALAWATRPLAAD